MYVCLRNFPKLSNVCPLLLSLNSLFYKTYTNTCSFKGEKPFVMSQKALISIPRERQHVRPGVCSAL